VNTGELDQWVKLEASAKNIIALLSDPKPGNILMGWCMTLAAAKRQASEAAMELGLPYIGLGHYQKTHSEEGKS